MGRRSSPSRRWRAPIVMVILTSPGCSFPSRRWVVLGCSLSRTMESGNLISICMFLGKFLTFFHLGTLVCKMGVGVRNSLRAIGLLARTLSRRPQLCIGFENGGAHYAFFLPDACGTPPFWLLAVISFCHSGTDITMGVDTGSKRSWNWRVAYSRSQRRAESLRTEHSWRDETEQPHWRRKPESGVLMQLAVHVGQGGIPDLKHVCSLSPYLQK